MNTEGYKKYVWIDKVAKAADTDIKNVFFGSEGCGIFMESGSLYEDIEYLRKRNISVGFVIPFLMPEREKNFKKLLMKLKDKTEIVVNDMGAFRLVEESGHTPIIGRLLTKQQTDPAIRKFYRNQPERKVLVSGGKALLRYASPPETLEKNFRGIPIFSNAASDVFLKNRNCISVILDVPMHGLPEKVPDAFEIILHKSNVMVAVLPCLNCADCPDKDIYIGILRSGVSIYRRGNICCYKLSDRRLEAEIAIPDYINKILYSL
ncbi:MAG: hypothetical protein FWD23_02435 [Oscillospiraceae bacterium]|nr:hypothetical protein [Oscillospiraceae bacterium]